MSWIRRTAALAATLCLAGGASAHGTPSPVSWFELLAVRGADGWSLRVLTIGDPAGMTGISVTPPGGTPLPLACRPSTAGLACRLRVPESGPGYDSLAELLLAYPAGSWQVAVSAFIPQPWELTGPVEVALADFEGDVAVTAPADGAVDVGTTPAVEWANGCAACNALRFALDDGADVDLAAYVTAPLPASGSVAWGAWTSLAGAAPAELGAGSYRASAAAGVRTASEVLLLGAFHMPYTTGVEHESESAFRVPEPASPGAAALLALGVLTRRRRIHPR
jgi:MYXO-CTERM domain-containing protein